MNRLKDPREHDDLLNYRLKRLLALGGAPAIRLCEGRHGVARAQWRVVASLVERGAATSGELAARTGLDAPRASRLLAEVAAKGLARRAAPTGATRSRRYEATPAGAELYRALLPELAAINRRLMAVLDDDEAAVFERCLDRLTEHARDILSAGGGVDEKANRRLGGARIAAASMPPGPRRTDLPETTR